MVYKSQDTSSKRNHEYIWNVTFKEHLGILLYTGLFWINNRATQAAVASVFMQSRETNMSLSVENLLHKTAVNWTTVSILLSLLVVCKLPRLPAQSHGTFTSAPRIGLRKLDETLTMKWCISSNNIVHLQHRYIFRTYIIYCVNNSN